MDHSLYFAASPESANHARSKISTKGNFEGPPTEVGSGEGRPGPIFRFRDSLTGSDLVGERQPKIHTLIGIKNDAEAELEIIMAKSEPSRKRYAAEMQQLWGRKDTARTCNKGATHVRSDTLPLTAL
jgi:hypothetical protein